MLSTNYKYRPANLYWLKIWAIISYTQYTIAYPFAMLIIICWYNKYILHKILNALSFSLFYRCTHNINKMLSTCHLIGRVIFIRLTLLFALLYTLNGNYNTCCQAQHHHCYHHRRRHQHHYPSPVHVWM